MEGGDADRFSAPLKEPRRMTSWSRQRFVPFSFSFLVFFDLALFDE